MTNVVIASAARTARRQFQWQFCQDPGPRAWRHGDHCCSGARRCRGWRGLRDDPRPGADSRSGPEPGASGAYRRRPAHRGLGLGHQPGLRLGPSRRGAWRSAYSAWRCGHRGCGRSGKHEPLAPCGAYARGPEDGRHEAWSIQHDQGRSVGCLQRLSHGHNGRECCQAMADRPRGSRTNLRLPPRTRPKRPRRRASSTTR